MFRQFKRLYPYLWTYRLAMGGGLICLCLTNYLDIRVAVLLGGGIDVVGFQASVPAALQRALLNLFVLLTIGLAGASGLARFGMRQLIIGASRHIEYDFRNDFFRHLLRLSSSFYDRFRTGDLMSRATSDMDAIRMVIGPALMYLAGTLTIVPMTIVQMLRISPPLTLLCWLPLGLIGPHFYFFSRRIHRRFRRTQEQMSDLSANIQENFSGVRVIKVYSRENQQAGRFDRLSQLYVEENMRLALLQSIFIPLLTLIIGLAMLMLLWGGSVFIIRGSLTIGDLATFFVLLMASIWPMAALGWVLAQLERGAASMQRVEEIFQQRSEIGEREIEGEEEEEEEKDREGEGEGTAEAVTPKPEIPPKGGTPKLEGGTPEADLFIQSNIQNLKSKIPLSLQGRIEVRNLVFTYPGASRPSLENIDFVLPAGRVLGLTGPVGCGKSTLAVLLVRRYNPPPGTILLDGRDILDWPVQALRQQIGVVDQEPFLFSDTIEANIVYGLADGRREQHEAIARQAAQIAQLENEIGNFPAGYETILGERGINLSGGQRQRTALARALARDPALLVLDDALAAVDTQTEEAILRGLRRVLAERTTILVSHRISTVSLADTIIYLERGKIAEMGGHEELLACRGKYWSLAQRQRLAEEIEKIIDE